MKRVPLLIALVLTFSFGLAVGQEVHVESIDGSWMDGGTTYLNPGAITFHIRMVNNFGSNVGGFTNGFEVGGMGLSFAPITAAFTDPATMDDWFDLTNGINYFSADGANYDTAGAFGSKMTSTGFPNGMDTEIMTISTNISGVADGSMFCIDSAYFPPSGTWLWADGAGPPAFFGGGCWEVLPIPNLAPEITNCPGTDYTGDHCALVSYDFDATDTEGDNISFEKVSGPGTINATTGAWSYQPSLADVGAPVTLEVRACDDVNPPHCGAVCSYVMNFTNVAPACTFNDGSGFPGGGHPKAKGQTFTLTLTFDNVDCDPVTGVSIVGVTPAPVGTYGLTGNVFEFNTDVADGGFLFEFTIEATDGNLAVQCPLFVEVLDQEPFEVQIEKVHNAIQGMHWMVDVTVNKGSEDLKGFDILIAYDASALQFVSAVEGSIYDQCGWEYFEYRYGPYGNCDNACPSGMLRVVGIAETNNGPNHPTCFGPTPFSLFSLDFLVSDDRTLECQYVPIRFFWMDCGDNSLAYSTAEDPNAVIQGVSRAVYEYGMDPMIDIADPTTGFPTYTGYQLTCDNPDPDKPDPVQFVDFINGGIDIVCADSIDARGDINLNGTGHEIADAVLFSNYFVYGLGVFTINVAGQIAATDVNADGLTLSVADLVYLIRVIVGDALPYSKLSTVEASYTVNAGVVSIDQAMGGAYLVAAGNVTPTLLADNMELKYNYDGTNTHILVYSMEQGQTFEGQFIEAGTIISAEFATYEGAKAITTEMPVDYALAQNYPNPFNPVTNVSFALPTAGDYTLTVYNVTGQVVETFAGAAQAGVTTITWDASNQASGIYFYKLEVNNFSQTKKMVLLK